MATGSGARRTCDAFSASFIAFTIKGHDRHERWSLKHPGGALSPLSVSPSLRHCEPPGGCRALEARGQQKGTGGAPSSAFRVREAFRAP